MRNIGSVSFNSNVILNEVAQKRLIVRGTLCKTDKMKNPFKYGGVISGDAFCNRKDELSDLVRAMKNGQNLFVYSERRTGKTSLVLRALQELPKKQYLTAYVDLWPTDGELSFATATANAIVQSMSTTTEKMFETVKTFFGLLAPSMTFDDEGKPVITFGVRKDSRQSAPLEKVLAAPAKIAAQGKQNTVVVFDEFQQIFEYGDDIIERRLRSIIQTHESVSYIFLGSRKQLIKKMFLDKSSPLYRIAGHYPLGNIKEEHWRPFIRKRFLDAGKEIADKHIRSIYDLTQGHPFYTQHLCHAVWELCEENDNVTEGVTATAVKILLDRENSAYTALWESFTMNQRRFLRGLAGEPDKIKPFEADFIGRYGLGSPSNVQRAIEALLQRDIIDHDDSSPVIVDRFFRIWIRQLGSGFDASS